MGTQPDPPPGGHQRMVWGLKVSWICPHPHQVTWSQKGIPGHMGPALGAVLNCQAPPPSTAVEKQQPPGFTY